MICEDFTSHLWHRLEHHGWLYTNVHKLHHSYKNNVVIAALFDHPVDYTMFYFAASLGPFLLGKHMHVLTSFVWEVYRASESLDVHTGYEFSWIPYRLIPFRGGVAYHEYHHTHNIGNYSSFFTICDTIFGVNGAYRKYSKKVKQAREEHRAK